MSLEFCISKYRLFERYSNKKRVEKYISSSLLKVPTILNPLLYRGRNKFDRNETTFYNEPSRSLLRDPSLNRNRKKQGSFFFFFFEVTYFFCHFVLSRKLVSKYRRDAKSCPIRLSSETVYGSGTLKGGAEVGMECKYPYFLPWRMK